MLKIKEIRQNFNFIILEVIKQAEDACEVVANPKGKNIDKIVTRDDYIDNLKSSIENKCFSKIMNASPDDKETLNQMKALNTIAGNLERIGDYAVNIVMQTHYLQDPLFLQNYNYRDFFTEVINGLNIVAATIDDWSVHNGLKICRSEFSLDKIYAKNFKRIIQELENSSHSSENLVTSLFIFHYLERMGDSLLNIGEAIISAVLGERLKIRQYQGLEDTLGLPSEHPMVNFEFTSIWGTRSGCRIGRVYEKDNAQEVIFKEGNLKKLLREKENIEHWGKVCPGLPPKVMGFQQQEDTAALLLECLHGSTLKEIVLSGDTNFSEALAIIKDNILSLWRQTKQDQTVSASFTKQLFSRIDEVYKLHPEFDSTAKNFASLYTPAFSDLLKQADVINNKLQAPFTILIHGDFNIDNIIFNQEYQRMHFIDLNRSRQEDYVQDVSVFLISNFRIPIFTPSIRKRLNFVGMEFLEFARSFAKEQNDTTFELRLALGLIRSLITSTRFEFKKKFATEMYLRAVYLLKKITTCPEESWDSFEVPKDVLIY